MCPYFAMFPAPFVRKYLEELTKPGELVLDPFSGRGTTLLESLLAGREAIACDINPVAYCITAAKAQTPSLESVELELRSLQDRYGLWNTELELPSFFHRCFHPATLRQLVYLRVALNWRDNPIHTFIAALILGTLHGEMNRSTRYLSNQMPRTISSKPGYSIRYWRKRDMWPPRRDVFARLGQEAAFRLRDGGPERFGRAALGDSRALSALFPRTHNVKAVITSPPYFDITSFEEDQWLRLWFLGGPDSPQRGVVSRDDRHTQEADYWSFLTAVWMGVEPLMQPEGWIVCRIGAKAVKAPALRAGLQESMTIAFGTAVLALEPQRSIPSRRQTVTFRPGTVPTEEFDFVFRVTR
jgi:hypothetical protein